MLPQPVRAIFYKILRGGKAGRFVADMIAWGFYGYVKLFGIPPKQDLAGLTVISHKHKFIFFGIPKVASRSFYNLFVHEKREEFNIEWTEKPNAFFEAVAKYPDYYKFTFVRNPWSRIVSCHNSKIADNIIGKRARITSFYKHLKGGMSFEDFVYWLQTEEGQDAVADRHWVSQHKFLCDAKGELLCDTVGKYENLEQDWQDICERLGLGDLKLPHKGFVSTEGKTHNPSAKEAQHKKRQITDYKQYYTDELKELIAQRYAQDIELFDYEY